MDESRSTAKTARPRTLWLTAALGLAAAGWAAFQWLELVRMRHGESIVCGPGGGHCAELWDSPFASAVHAHSGLPVAGWGVVWGIAAFVLPLVAAIRVGRRRIAATWVAGTLLVAFAGALGTLGLLAAQFAFGQYCLTCLGTYAVALAYAGVAIFGLGFAEGADLGRGAALAFGIAALSYAALFVPGQRTPHNVVSEGAKAVESLPQPVLGTDDEREIARFIQSLTPEVQQLLSDTLAAYSAAPVWTPPEPRVVIGAADARLAFTEFTDTLCSHCAQMYEVLVQLRQRFGPNAFSLAPHQYPLDPLCNPNVHVPQSQPIRCLAAKVQICTEGKPGDFEFVGELFRNQAKLDDELLWKLAEPMGGKAELEKCANSPETAKKLADDMAWATAHGIKGTPLLLVDGLEAIAFPPLIYVLALSRGAVTSPAYASLPSPQPLPWQK